MAFAVRPDAKTNESFVALATMQRRATLVARAETENRARGARFPQEIWMPAQSEAVLIETPDR